MTAQRILITEALRAFVPYGPEGGETSALQSPEFTAELAKHPTHNSADLSLFVVLDAAVLTNLPELLAASGLEHACLFQGDSFDELSNVAPWVVKLAPDAAFTRDLFTQSDVPWHFWGRHGGLFLQASLPLQEVCNHLRKFLKVELDPGRWMYVRFWEDVFQSAIEDSLNQGHVAAARVLMGRHPGQDISLLTRDLTRRLTLAPMPDKDRAPILNTPISKVIQTLRPFMAKHKLTRDLHRLAVHATPDGFTRVDEMAQHLRIFYSAGFRNLAQLDTLARIEFQSGFRFSADPFVRAILEAGSCDYAQFVSLMQFATTQGYADG